MAVNQLDLIEDLRSGINAQIRDANEMYTKVASRESKKYWSNVLRSLTSTLQALDAN